MNEDVIYLLDIFNDFSIFKKIIYKNFSFESF